jgi:nucleoid DNA-binding protein
MKKPEFIAEMAEKSGLTKTQADAALAAFLETVADAVVGESTVIPQSFANCVSLYWSVPHTYLMSV